MRSIIFFLSVLLFTALLAEYKNTPLVNVECNTLEKELNCKITIKEPFALNREAPFKFKLKDNKNNVVENVTKSQFSGDGKHNFDYKTKTIAEHYSYWFVACKYANEKITACKTFKGEK